MACAHEHVAGVHAGAVQHLRQWRDNQQLLPLEAAFLSNHTLDRYAAARRGDAAAAEKMLAHSLEWRNSAVSPPLNCTACEINSTSHCFFPIGCDNTGNPVIYGCPPRASNTHVEPTVQHVVHQLEHCWGTTIVSGTCTVVETSSMATSQPELRLAENGTRTGHEHRAGDAAAPSDSDSASRSPAADATASPVAGQHAHQRPCSGEQWVWVVDFRGFGFTHAMQARLGISFAKVFADHFPERLKALCMINPPTVFQLLLSAIKPFADERTMSKVQVLSGTDAEVCKQLGERGLSSETVEWMRKVLAMDPVPGSLPPLPASTKRMQLPGIKFRFEGDEG